MDIERIRNNYIIIFVFSSNPNIDCSKMPSLKLPCTPVHGGWSNWIQGSHCTQFYRTCTNPRPNACGNKCVGESNRTIHRHCGIVDHRASDTKLGPIDEHMP